MEKQLEGSRTSDLIGLTGPKWVRKGRGRLFPPAQPQNPNCEYSGVTLLALQSPSPPLLKLVPNHKVVMCNAYKHTVGLLVQYWIPFNIFYVASYFASFSCTFSPVLLSFLGFVLSIFCCNLLK